MYLLCLSTPVSSFRHQNCPLLCSRKSPEWVYINSQLTVLSHKRRKTILLWCSDLLKEIQATSSSFISLSPMLSLLQCLTC